jgi:hypothetical protein
MAETLTVEEQAMLDKARNITQTTIGQSQSQDGPVGPPTDAEEWGPYYDENGKPVYKLVNPPNGAFGVPPGKILYFVTRTVFSRKEGMMKDIKLPMYRNPGEDRQN